MRKNIIGIFGQTRDLADEIKSQKEPTFTLYAKDMFSNITLRYYIEHLEKDSNCPSEYIQYVKKVLFDFEQWQFDNQDKIMTPE